MNSLVEKLDMKVMGDRLQKVRQHLKLKQSDVAAEIGCSTLTISRIERGEMSTSLLALLVFYSQSVSLDMLFANAFDADDDEVYGKNPALQSHVKARLKLLQEDVIKHVTGQQREFGNNVQKLAAEMVQELNRQMMKYTCDEQNSLLKRLDDTIELL